MNEEERKLRLVITCLMPDELAVTKEHVERFNHDVIKEYNDIMKWSHRACADPLEQALNINIKARENMRMETRL